MQLVKTERDNLLRPLQTVSGIVERRHTLPILANLLITKNGPDVSFLSTDLELQITTRADFGVGGWRNDAGWDDFNIDPNQRWKDHSMTYASLDGPIDTIQWEGFREGVDDVRYLRTLQAHIRRARSSGRPDLVAMGRSAETWINGVPIQSKPRVLPPGAVPPHDLDALRQQMIRRILDLRDAMK